MTPALYLIDTSGLFRILQDKLRQAWADQLAAGVIATCPVVELEFLHSARSLADRLDRRTVMIVGDRTPMIFAACTYSRLRSDSASPRTSRAGDERPRLPARRRSPAAAD